MKHYYTLLLLLAGLLISSHSVAQGSLAALDAKNGFKDAKFGMPLSAFKGMVIEENGVNGSNRKYYKRPSYDSKLDKVQLEYIEYSFYKGILDKIVFAVKGKANCEDVLLAIQSVYGSGSKWPTGMGISWKGSVVYLNLSYMQDEGRDYYRFEMGNDTYMINENKKERQDEIKRMSKEL